MSTTSYNPYEIAQQQFDKVAEKLGSIMLLVNFSANRCESIIF